jgi:hypothetical protein
MGTPLYPKDQATEWQNMKKDVRMLFTSATYRRALQQIGATALKVWKSIEIQAGAFLSFQYANGTIGMFMGRHWTGSEDADGIIIRRADSSIALWIHSRVSDGYGFSALYDKTGNIIFSDDGNSGTGMARPWLTNPFVNTAELVTPPAARKTTSTTDTPVVTFIMPDQHPRIRVEGYVYNPGGGTNNVKLKEAGSGTELFSGSYAGTNYAWFNFTVNNPLFEFGTVRIYDITIRRSAGAGEVGITILNVMGVQS